LKIFEESVVSSGEIDETELEERKKKAAAVVGLIGGGGPVHDV